MNSIGILSKINIWMKSFLVILGSTLFGLMLASIADAANQEQVPVEVEFVSPITITEDSELNFGLLDVNLAGGETVIIAPDDSVTDASSRVVGGVQRAADLAVGATASQAITILVDNVSAAKGYTLGTWMCNYEGAASDSACDGAGYSETTVAIGTLKVGVTLTGNGSAVVGTDDSNFDITIIYE